MESSIAVFLSRRFACEQPPTIRMLCRHNGLEGLIHPREHVQGGCARLRSIVGIAPPTHEAMTLCPSG